MSFCTFSFGHYFVCSSSLRYTDSNYSFGICWPLRCLFFSSIQGFWLPRWYLLAIVLSVLLLFDIRILITPLVSVGHCVVCSSSLRYTDSDYPFGIFWPLCCLFFFSSMNGFWLPLFCQQYLFKSKSKSDWECVNGTLGDFGCFFVLFYNLGLYKVRREYLWLNWFFLEDVWTGDLCTISKVYIFLQSYREHLTSDWRNQFGIVWPNYLVWAHITISMPLLSKL